MDEGETKLTQNIKTPAAKKKEINLNNTIDSNKISSPMN